MRVGLPQSLIMDPIVAITGRDVILTCDAVPDEQYDEIYIQRDGKGKCGLLTHSTGKCEKPTSTTCGIDPDILVSCGQSGPDTPLIKVTKKNLDTNDNGLWECFGTGPSALYVSVTITVGK